MYLIKMLYYFCLTTHLNRMDSRDSHFMSRSVYCQPQIRQYWKQFSLHSADSQTISERRANQNASGVINKSERGCMLLTEVMNYTNFFYRPLCVYIDVYVVLHSSMRSSECIIELNITTEPSMWSANRLHHVPPTKHATYSTQGYSHET